MCCFKTNRPVLKVLKLTPRQGTPMRVHKQPPEYIYIYIYIYYLFTCLPRRAGSGRAIRTEALVVHLCAYCCLLLYHYYHHYYYYYYYYNYYMFITSVFLFVRYLSLRSGHVIVHPVSVRRFPCFRTQPLESLSVDSVKKWIPEQPSPWRKS